MRPLTGATFKDRLRIMTVLAGRGGRRLRRVVSLPARAAARLRAKPPERLIIAPQDIRTSDPTIAAELGAGYFAFGGKIVHALGRSPFVIAATADPDDGSAWTRQLAGFGWLRHLRAADTSAGRQRGRVLVDDFLAVHGRPSRGTAWEPPVAARRMLAWLSQSPVILDGADRAFYQRFMQALEVHRANLDRQIARGLAGDDRLLVAVALTAFGLCAQSTAALQRRGSDILAAEIATQILPDGGHVSRDPQALIDLLLELLPLRQAYAARGIQAPQPVLNAIDRMMPMLRLFRHGDGPLALFNGMGVTAPELVATILAYDDVRAQPVTNARYAGYQRLEAGSALVIVDSGASPPADFSSKAHAGCLAFEFSSGRQRIVVNCGALDGSRAGARDAARSTAAHSTLVVDDTSSCRFASPSVKRWLGDRILAGPVTVAADRTEDAGVASVAMSHDGYAARFGLVHHRTLTLAADGHRLDGVDQLDGGKRTATAVPYALRFHLHPSVRARATGDGATIQLDTPDGGTWLFEADLAPVVEPSILFAAVGGPRPANQIKIAADSGTRNALRWSFRRLA